MSEKSGSFSKIIALFLMVFVPTYSGAQLYPSKPVRLIIPSSPGGPIDIIGRSLAQGLSMRFGQSVLVDNRPGATGIIAADMLAKSAPDGYTIMLAAGTFSTTAAFHPKLPYDPAKDFAPISQVAMLPLVVLIHPSLPVNSIGELISYTRSNPGKVFFGSSGNAGPSHLAGEVFKSMAGVNIVHVPYKGTSPAMADLMAGHIQMMFDAVTTAVPQARAGKVKALAVTSPKRLRGIPDVPTVAEAGLPGYEAVTWVGILAPRGTPPEVVARLHSEITRSLQSTEISQEIAAVGAEVIGNTPDQFSENIRLEIEKWSKLARETNIKID